jgi:hypothetical protein
MGVRGESEQQVSVRLCSLTGGGGIQTDEQLSSNLLSTASYQLQLQSTSVEWLVTVLPLLLMRTQIASKPVVHTKPSLSHPDAPPLTVHLNPSLHSENGITNGLEMFSPPGGGLSVMASNNDSLVRVFDINHAFR